MHNGDLIIDPLEQTQNCESMADQEEDSMLSRRNYDLKTSRQKDIEDQNDSVIIDSWR